MTDLIPVFPTKPVPPLTVPLVGGGSFALAAERPRLFTMLVFYRGYHCAQCQIYLRDLESRLPEFEQRGVGTVAISADETGRAAATKTEWELANLRLGYGLDIKVARSWGLYVTAGRPKAGISEPDVYTEPALFLVHPDGRLFFSAVQTMPFARPRFEDVLYGFDFMFERGFTLIDDYPGRGEVVNLREVGK
jgi:peroxiredoxin